MFLLFIHRSAGTIHPGGSQRRSGQRLEIEPYGAERPLLGRNVALAGGAGLARPGIRRGGIAVFEPVYGMKL